MTNKKVSPSVEEAQVLLNELWSSVLNGLEIEIDSTIDALIDSSFVSIRFCLPTQLLGKLVDKQLNCLCLQKGIVKSAFMWDPRGFASKVIIPWVAENQFVLGTSTDPYVSKPLRKAYLESSPGNVKGKEEWKTLFHILNEVESRNSEDFTRLRMLQTLASIHKRLSSLSFVYYIPERVSIEQTGKLIQSFLSEGSGGDRGLSVAAGLFQTFGKFFQIYREVRRHVVNASDQSTGLSGDIECIGEDGSLKLSIEVKERNLTLTDMRSAVLKARKVSIQELLLNSPGTNPSEEREILDLISKTWASGTNLYRISIDDLIRVGLSLTGEAGRKDFLENVGKQLDTYNTQPSNRKRWKELLEEI